MDHPMSSRQSLNVMIKVVVGVDDQEIIAYKSALVQDSAFFRGALTGGWKEAEKREVHLPEANAAAFSTFVRWAYTRSLKLTQEDAHRPLCAQVVKRHARNLTTDASSDATRACSLPAQKCPHQTCTDLMHAYILGDQIMSSTYKNAVIDEMIARNQFHGSIPTLPLLEYAYENTPETALLRKLLVDQVIWHGDSDTFFCDIAKTTGPVALMEFGRDVLGALLQQRGQVGAFHRLAPYFQDACKAYHEHDGTEHKRCRTLSVGEWEGEIADA